MLSGPGTPGGVSTIAGAEQPLTGPEAARVAEHYQRLFRDARRKRVRQLVAGLAIVAGCSLWACNGVMRSAYLHQIASTQTGPQIQSIALAPARVATPGNSAAGSSTSRLSSALEPAVIVGSEVIFLLILLVTAATHSAVGLREQISANAAQLRRHRNRLLKRALPMIEQYDKVRSRVAEIRVQADQEERVASAGVEDEDDNESAAGG